MQIYSLEITPANLYFIANVVWHRGLFTICGIHNPSSLPYLSGDTFRTLATHVFDEQVTFNPQVVKAHELVFVSLRCLKKYFATVHPQIVHPYVLITHNGDLSINETFTQYIDAKLIHWFSQNVTVKHPKLTPLPIGLENLDYYNHGITSLFDRQRTIPVVKRPRILSGFSLTTNPQVRIAAARQLAGLPTADAIEGRLNAQQYTKCLANYMFVASPPGNGLDCHRTWEAMYLETMPIVLHSQAMAYFVGLGMPIWMIDDWSDLARYDESQLHAYYQTHYHQFKSKALWFDFWQALIKDKTI